MGRLEIDENSSVRVGRQHEGHLVQGKSVVRTHEGHIVEMTDIPVIMKAVVNKRQGDKLVYGVAEIPMPIVSDEKDLIIKVEAAPINPSDLGSVGMLARFVADSIAVGEAAFTVTVPVSSGSRRHVQG